MSNKMKIRFIQNEDIFNVVEQICIKLSLVSNLLDLK